MPKKAKSTKEESFNWKGIRDNKDGTFDVSDKWAKNRLQKEFRRQGIRTRSQRSGTKGFIVYPVGQRKTRARGMGRLPKKEKQYYPGYKPRTRMTVAGPRPQLQQTARPRFIGRPSYPSSRRIGSGPIAGPIMREGGEAIGRSIRNASIRREERVNENYYEKRRLQKAARAEKAMQKVREWERRTGRSPGQIDKPEERAPAPQQPHVQRPVPAGVRRTTELPRRYPADTEEGGRRTITSSGIRKTTELPEHKPDYQKMQHERAEAMERFSKIKLGEHEQ